MDRKLVNDGRSEGKKYIIAQSKKLGRYIIAAKDLSAGEVIFRDDALAVGPALFETSLFCFACMRALSAQRANEAPYRCSKCNVAPLCSERCESCDANRHTIGECELLRDRQSLCRDSVDELSRILLHLRLWLLRRDDPEAWSRTMGMEAHLDKRRNTPVWSDREKNVIEVFRKFAMTELEDAPTESSSSTSTSTPNTKDSSYWLLQRLCGVVDVNTFELRPPGSRFLGPNGGPLLRGLYAEAALMSHACRPTAHVTVDGAFRMSVHAAVNLAAGEVVSFNYTSSLLGTIERQEHLREGKYFRCECEACRDPLEAGSYLSCIVCPRCRRDYVAMQSPRACVSGDPYGRRAKWQCRKCKRIFRGCLVNSAIELSKNLIKRTDHGNLKAMENLLAELSRTFHENHFVMLMLKQKILDIYRKELRSVNPRRSVLKRMLAICKELIDVLDVVEPGISRLKGILTYEMHLPIAILATRDYAAREISAAEMLAQLEEARGHLKRSLAMLLLEPADTPEGLLAKRGLREMRALIQSVEDARALMFADAAAEADSRAPRAPRRRGGAGGKESGRYVCGRRERTRGGDIYLRFRINKKGVPQSPFRERSIPQSPFRKAA